MNKYKEYLKSKTWKKRRYAKVEEAGFKCENCSETSYLEVHHKHYGNLFNEDTKDLMVLCKGCHWIADQKRKDPNFKVPEDAPDEWHDIEPLPPKFDHSRIPIHLRKSQFD